jgi:leucyl/phenylalanyl-tRNA--protein transferase
VAVDLGDHPPVPIFRLPRAIAFPDPALAEPDGLLAVGGDLSPERLLRGYAHGLFPWYSEGQPILWWSPDPRWILVPAELHVPRSLAKDLRSGRYRVTADTAFSRVVERCARKRRPGQRGTWITRDMSAAYGRLHELGFAHSVEAWDGSTLAGGLYGVSLGGAFFGESMFADRPDASKAAFVTLVGELRARGFGLVDCQVHTEHLERFGARGVPRDEFLLLLKAELAKPTWRGAWELAGRAAGDAGAGAEGRGD